jgi:hypothetical protein
MYYDANGADYISTPSFALPNTGILTIEAWMKSQISAVRHSIIGDGNSNGTIGYLEVLRYLNSDSLYYYYANGTGAIGPSFPNFFTSSDNQ